VPELDRLLTSLPTWPQVETAVTPLTTLTGGGIRCFRGLSNAGASGWIRNTRYRWPTMNPRIVFGLSIAASLPSSIVASILFGWPLRSGLRPEQALLWLVAPHMFLRFIGLTFLVLELSPKCFPKRGQYPPPMAILSRGSWQLLPAWDWRTQPVGHPRSLDIQCRGRSRPPVRVLPRGTRRPATWLTGRRILHRNGAGTAAFGFARPHLPALTAGPR